MHRCYPTFEPRSFAFLDDVPCSLWTICDHRPIRAAKSYTYFVQSFYGSRPSDCACDLIHTCNLTVRYARKENKSRSFNPDPGTRPFAGRRIRGFMNYFADNELCRQYRVIHISRNTFPVKDCGRKKNHCYPFRGNVTSLRLSACVLFIALTFNRYTGALLLRGRKIFTVASHISPNDCRAGNGNFMSKIGGRRKTCRRSSYIFSAGNDNSKYPITH